MKQNLLMETLKRDMIPKLVAVTKKYVDAS
jgi:hypothetical protein